MKYYTLLVAFLVSSLFCFAQKDFEGIVQYDFKVVQLNFTWFTMEVYYKNNKVLVKVIYKRPNNQ
ncbi:MAG: hypothetical protein WDM90_09430 [Ferruginibacter sp.]